MASTTTIPSPTEPLGWSDFGGAIHDVFSANARKFPDRKCVVQTGSSSTPEATWTYRHIEEASNVLAHHLVQHGVRRGEHVMIYSSRCADLVVAFMGVLKAGAAMSVIDPQYPPERQIVYLDVARPRALITIARASEEAGELAPEVRRYIDGNLDLRTEIPALALHPDGTLLGGSGGDGGKDFFDEQQDLKSKGPGLVVGPDDQPTLSFTSGSEGRPKGVKGRHFSLTYYFPWMAEKFNLSENDRWTMLSGIAHDPIQRDIFTPLFLGGSLYVPPSEVITFDSLAQWFAVNKCTVTHLTPAMGQILLGSTEPKIPSLHHAFFVGDILLKRDVARLRELAPNCAVVNMYGTTETQRAVSYYEVPSANKSPKYLESISDVIPAGKGMKNVQLLVVDRKDRNRICSQGEIGEIYVRAGGLAEGYLGTDLIDLTNSKFIQNWFVDPQTWTDLDKRRVESQGGPEPWREYYKGPRDRLYRSGDLGRYMRDGNVECTGRADDQVKIRGFRIELGEIDTHLSQHPLIRENVTLVRRNKDEEHILVSYVVPDLQKWYKWIEGKGDNRLLSQPEDNMVAMLRKFRSLTDDVRTYLKTKLATYAVPTLFVPMIRLPLTPNGKVDKRALPFPEDSDLMAAAPRRISAALPVKTATEARLAQMWSSLIRGTIAKTIAPDASFFDLGGNSITAQQLLSQVRKEWSGVNIPITTLFRKPTLSALASEIDRALDPLGLRLEPEDVGTQGEHYSSSLSDLTKHLPDFIRSADIDATSNVTFFLTGATGFLGAYILRDILLNSTKTRVITLVRAADQDHALGRIKQTCEAYGIWDDAWASRIEAICGDLQKQNLGIQTDTWKRLATDVDVIIHNGAIVHWVLPYSSLKAANVLSTIAMINLCAQGKPKQLAFISSTSALDTEHYVNMSDRIMASGGNGIREADTLEGSRQGLGTGYGQTKWVSEYLVREAGGRGLRGSIVRSGYVLGDPVSGTLNTDDFLIRLLKGCVQLECRPDMTNTINMVPVNHVARLCVAAALHPAASATSVVHVNSHPRLRFNEYLEALETYGYEVPKVDYDIWRSKMEQYVATTEAQGREEHALLGLYSMVTGDLPGSTKAPELDDTNAAAALRADSARSGSDVSRGAAVTQDTVGVYLAFLVARGFMPAPAPTSHSNSNASSTANGSVKRKELPYITLSSTQLQALDKVGGRGGAGEAKSTNENGTLRR